MQHVARAADALLPGIWLTAVCAAVAPVTQTALNARPAVSAQDLTATTAAAVATHRVTTHVLAAAVADVTLVNVCNRQ